MPFKGERAKGTQSRSKEMGKSLLLSLSSFPIPPLAPFFYPYLPSSGEPMSPGICSRSFHMNVKGGVLKHSIKTKAKKYEKVYLI